MMTPSEVYRAYIDAETRRDEDDLARYLATDLQVEIDGAPALASANDDLEALARIFVAYPDYHREIIEIIEQDDRAAARWRMVGHPRPELAGKLPAIDIRGVSVVAVVDERMTEAYVWSPSGALEGVLAALAELSQEELAPPAT